MFCHRSISSVILRRFHSWQSSCKPLLQVALETKKARQPGPTSAGGQTEGQPAASGAAAAAPEVPAATSRPNMPMKQPQAHGLAMEPHQQSISPAVSPWSSPYRSPQGVSPADTPIIASAGHTPAVSSPVSSENTFTLLPGYVSRPGPSPLKKPRRPSPTRESGGKPPLCTASLQFPRAARKCRRVRRGLLHWHGVQEALWTSNTVTCDDTVQEALLSLEK